MSDSLWSQDFCKTCLWRSSQISIFAWPLVVGRVSTLLSVLVPMSLQDSQEFLRCFMDQIHEELKQAEPRSVAAQTDDDTDSSSADSAITTQTLDFRSRDVPFQDENPSSPGTSDSHGSKLSDTDYETCDSGMSSERSSVENANVEEATSAGLGLSKERPGTGRRRKTSDQHQQRSTDSGSKSDSLLETVGEEHSAKERKESANKAHQRASSRERPVTIGGGDSGDNEFSDAVTEMEPLQVRTRDEHVTQ